MKKLFAIAIIVLLLSVSAAWAQGGGGGVAPTQTTPTPTETTPPKMQPPPIQTTPTTQQAQPTRTTPPTTQQAQPTRAPQPTKPPKGITPPPRQLTDVEVRALQELGKTDLEISSYLQRGQAPPPELLEKRQNLVRILNIPAEELEQFGSVAQAFQTFVAYYKQFSGLAGWSALIFDEGFLKDWREKVNFVMCDTLHLPTKDCWTSKICGAYSDIKPSRDGVLFNTAVGGAPQAVGHIEGQRSMPIVLPNGTMWGYTVTFGLTNPTDEDMSYNVRFSGQRSATWWSSGQTIGGGGRVNALGAAALYKLSSTEYSQVCLEFSPSITGFGGKRIGKICNDIVQYAGGATAPYPGPAAPEATPGAAPTTPASGQPGWTAPPGYNV